MIKTEQQTVDIAAPKPALAPHERLRIQRELRKKRNRMKRIVGTDLRDALSHLIDQYLDVLVPALTSGLGATVMIRVGKPGEGEVDITALAAGARALATGQLKEIAEMTPAPEEGSRIVLADEATPEEREILNRSLRLVP